VYVAQRAIVSETRVAAARLARAASDCLITRPLRFFDLIA
jgi:hypothetical protein